MRLIDADFLSKELKKSTELLNGNTLVPVNLLLSIIDKTPTAYDVDKVVEQLKLRRDCYERKAAKYDEHGDMQNMDISDSISLAYGKAIEIVRAGGLNEQ